MPKSEGAEVALDIIPDFERDGSGAILIRVRVPDGLKLTEEEHTNFLRIVALTAMFDNFADEDPDFLDGLLQDVRTGKHRV